MSMSRSLVTLPEELTERIFADVFTPSSSTNQAPWSTRTPKSAPLLTCKLVRRIATPLFYRNVTLRSPAQAALLARTLYAIPSLSLAVRGLALEGVWSEGLSDVLSACPSLQALDIVLDDGWKGKTWAMSRPSVLQDTGLVNVVRGLSLIDVEGFCDALGHVRDLKRLTVRKEASTYLTQPGPSTILHELGKHIARWTSLVRLSALFAYSTGGSSCLMAYCDAGTCGDRFQVYE